MAGSTSWEEVTSPEDYKNINPYSDQIMPDLMSGLQSIFSQGMAPGTGFMEQFMKAVPGLQGITSSAMAPFEKQGQDYVSSLMAPMQSKVGNMLAGMNAGHSSAMPRMFMQEMTPAIQQMGTQRAQLGANMFGGLAQTAMPLFQQGDLARKQMGMQAGAQLGDIGDPNMVSPTMGSTYEPGLLDYLGPILAGGADFMSMFK